MNGLSTRSRRFALGLALTISVLCVSSVAFAQATSFVPVQGVLTDAEEKPISGTQPLTFRLYASDASDNLREVWSTTRSVSVDSGHFSVYLGESTPLSPSLFNDNRRVMLGITVGEDTEMPLIEIGLSPFAGFAHHAGDAETVSGKTVDELNPLASIACQPGAFLGYDGTAWTCADAPGDTLSGLSCGSGEIARFDGTGWACATDRVLTENEVDTLVASSGYVKTTALAPVATTGDFGSLTNVPTGVADGDDDTLGNLSCQNGEVPTYTGSSWACGAQATYVGTAPITVTGNEIGLAASSIDDSHVAPNAGIAPTKIAGTAATLTGNQSFDNGTFRIDATANRVGVGKAPTTALDVAGTTTSTDFRYGTPRTGRLQISPTSFVTARNEDDFMAPSTSGYLTPEVVGTDGIFTSYVLAPVTLPADATVTELRCYRYDSESTENITGTASLRRQQETSTTYSTMASVDIDTTGANFSLLPVSDTTISNAVIDSTSRYFLYVSFTTTNAYVGDQLRFYGCAIDYTYTSLGH